MHFFSRLTLCLLVVGCSSVPYAYAEKSITSAVNAKHDNNMRRLATQTSSQYSSRQLSDSVGLALQANPQLKAALKSYRSDISGLEVTESAFLPQISLSLGLGREDSNNTSSRALNGSGSDEYERREASVSLQQMLFDGFDTHWRREKGLNDIQAERWKLLDQAEQLALSAMGAHMEVMRTKQVLEDHIANLQTHERIAKDIGIRARLGKDDRAKVSQISARLSLSLANVEAAKGNFHAANSAYRRVVGSKPGAVLVFKPGLVPMPESLDELLDVLKASNPLLKSESRRIRAAKAERKVAQSSDLPDVYFESGASWNANVDGVRGRNSDSYVMLRMDYALYSGGRDRASKKRAHYLSEQAQYQYEDVQDEIQLLAEQAWYAYESLSRRYGLLQDYVESAQSTKSAYIKQFEIGQRSLIDLLDAENELLKAKRLRIDARHELYLAKFEILRLQGKLLAFMSYDERLAKDIENTEES